MPHRPKLQVKLPYLTLSAKGALAVYASIIIILAALALFRF